MQIRFNSRSVLFFSAGLLVTYALTELISLGAFSIISAGGFSYPRLQAARRAVIEASIPISAARAAAQSGPIRTALQQYITHPYLGFVQNPENVPGVNEHGFDGPLPPFGTSTGIGRDTLVVAVVGGSVARGLVRAAGRTLSHALRGISQLNAKEVRVVSLAIDGGKQPQQLIVVNYLLSLGARVDVVVNLDGFNEIVLPTVENTRLGIFPYYPRMWKLAAAGLSDPEFLQTAGRMAYLTDRRRRNARVYSSRLVRLSPTANLVWFLLDRRSEWAIQHLRTSATLEMLDRYSPRRRATGYMATGPERSYESEADLFADLAAYWRRSSRLLSHIAPGSGFQYFHFLQPNQHVENSKIFTAEERAIAFPPNDMYRSAARTGYPFLIEAGRKLAKDGVAFTDLTMIFVDNDAVLYADGCCHFNERGYELIALEIADVIRNSLNESPASSR